MTNDEQQSFDAPGMSPGSVLRYACEPEYQQLLDNLVKIGKHRAVSIRTTDLSAPDVATETSAVPDRCGRFQVERLLGKGSFGTVYLAFDPLIDRHIALKVAGPRPRMPIERLIEEARSAARLNHPGIVTVYEVGHTDDNLYIAMEYVDSGTLREFMTKDLDLSTKLAAVAEIAEAMHAAHKQEIVHRDLKPENIMMTEDGHPKVVDFGLAVGRDKGAKLAGEIAGAPPYMSPEQVRGDADLLDGRTDIWAIGVILYEMLLGRRPFAGSQNELAREILHREARPLRQIDDKVPREVERVVLKCLEKKPGDRYSTGKDVASALKAQVGKKPYIAWKVTSMTVLAVVVFGAFWFAGANQDLSDLAPDVSEALFTKEIKPIFLPPGEANALWNQESDAYLWVASTGASLFETGETAAQNYRLSSTLWKRAPTGEAGIYFGYTTDEEGVETCQCVVLNRVSPKHDYFDIHRKWVRINRVADKREVAVHAMCQHERVELDPTNDISLEVRIWHGEVAEIRCNNILVKGLSAAKVTPRVSGVGGFGLFHFGGDTLFRFHKYQNTRDYK